MQPAAVWRDSDEGNSYRVWRDGAPSARPLFNHSLFFLSLVLIPAGSTEMILTMNPLKVQDREQPVSPLSCSVFNSDTGAEREPPWVPQLNRYMWSFKGKPAKGRWPMSGWEQTHKTQADNETGFGQEEEKELNRPGKEKQDDPVLLVLLSLRPIAESSQISGEAFPPTKSSSWRRRRSMLS